MPLPLPNCRGDLFGHAKAHGKTDRHCQLPTPSQLHSSPPISMAEEHQDGREIARWR